MTCEDIIQRLLDERHITVKEAIIMIKSLVSNLKDQETTSTLSEPKTISPPDNKHFWKPSTVAVAYGVIPDIGSSATQMLQTAQEGLHIDVNSSEQFVSSCDMSSSTKL